MVFLALLVAEINILLLKEHWSFNEPFDESVAGVKESARELAVTMLLEFRDSEASQGRSEA